MLSDENNYGSMSSTDVEKRKYASFSMEFNRKNPIFSKMFPDLMEDAIEEESAATSESSSSTTTTTAAEDEKADPTAPQVPLAPVAITAPAALPAVAQHAEVPAKAAPKPEQSIGWIFAAIAVIIGVLALNKYS